MFIGIKDVDLIPTKALTLSPSLITLSNRSNVSRSLLNFLFAVDAVAKLPRAIAGPTIRPIGKLFVLDIIAAPLDEVLV